jgi:hypothetical protein
MTLQGSGFVAYELACQSLCTAVVSLEEIARQLDCPEAGGLVQQER